MNLKIQFALLKGKIAEIETIIKELRLDHTIDKEFLRHLAILSQHFAYNLSHGSKKPIHIPKALKESRLDKVYKKILEGSDNEKERRIVYQKAMKAKAMADVLLPFICGYELQKNKKIQIPKSRQRSKAA